jgi:hypothetical protein
MSGLLLEIKDFYWAHREALGILAAGLVFVCAQVVILLWTLRRLQELSNIRERMSRLADGLALLTDTTEAGLAAVAQQVEQLGRKAKSVRSSSRPSVAKRVVDLARKGERITRIAEHEALSESEVRLHLAMSKPRLDGESTPPLAS